jgi:YD repeat-containing protein
MTTTQFPDGTTNLQAYNSQGNVIKVTDGRSNPTTYSFDALNRGTGSTDALGDITTITLDAAGNVTKVQAPTPAGQTARTTTYAYDSMNRLGTVTDALGQQTIFGHDSDGNVTTVKDPLGRLTTTQFDQMDRPVVVIDPMGNRVTTTYDADGEKLTVTDALNRTTSYSYSVRGWVSTVTDPMGYVVTYIYTAISTRPLESRQRRIKPAADHKSRCRDTHMMRMIARSRTRTGWLITRATAMMALGTGSPSSMRIIIQYHTHMIRATASQR